MTGPDPNQCDFVTDSLDGGLLHCLLDRNHDGDHSSIGKYKLPNPVWRKYEEKTEGDK